LTDHLTKERRSKNMAAIKACDTRPELLVRRLIYGLGYRYRLHRQDLPGKPDLTFASRRAIIFVHGCFWHQHKSVECRARPPKSNTSYWIPKLRKNVERDRQNKEALESAGWKVLVIWECEMADLHSLKNRVISFLG